MKLTMRATATLGKKVTLITAAFVLAVSTLTAAGPFVFSSKASAVGSVSISNITELRSAIENQEDGQVWTVQPGTYGLSPFTDLEVQGQTGWYFPITADNLTINGVGNPTIYGTGYSPNGNWATQNLVSVFGDDVTISGFTLMPKVQPNKTVEVLGEDFTLRNTTIAPNTLTDSADYASVSAEYKQWGGSLYFNHAGNHTVDNVTIKNSGISFRYSPSGTNIAFTNTKLDYATSVDWINSYRYSAAFNNAGNSITGVPAVTYHVNDTFNNVASVAAALKDGDTIELDSNISLASQLTLTKAITLNGNGHTISANFVKTGNDNNSVIGVQSNNVKLNNVTVDAVTNANNLHGINVYQSEGVALTDVTAKNGNYAGVNVNGSKVTAENLSTSGSALYGVNVDKTNASFTIKGQGAHSESVPIYVDNRSVGQVVDVDDRYDIVEVGLGAIYVLDVTAPNVPTHLSPSADALQNTNNFWFDWSDESASGAVRYELQNSQSGAVDANGSFQNVQWTGDYQRIQPTESKAQSVGASGIWYWQVRAIDAAGNASAWTTPWKVNIDVEKPTAPQLNTPTNNQVFTTNSIPATWTASTDANGINKYQIEYIYDDGHTFAGGPFREVSGTTTTRTHAPGTDEQGGVTIRVRAFDNAGNAGDWSNSVHYYYDNTKPTVSIDSAVVTNATKTLDVSVTANDSFSGVKRIEFNLYDSTNTTKLASLNGQNYTDFATTKTLTRNGFDITALLSGNYVIRAAALDNAGLLSTYATQTISIDNTAPTAEFIFPTAGPSATSFQVKFSEAVNEAEAENAANYRLENWPGAGGSGDLLGDATVAYNAATKTATVTFTNSAWYVSPEQKWGVSNIHDLVGNALVDTTAYSTPLVAPEFTSSPASSGPVNAQTQTWSWAAIDPTDSTNASGIKNYEYSFVSADVSPTTWVATNSTSVTTTASGDGTYRLYVRIIDNAGNVSASEYGEITIDTTPPAAAITSFTSNGASGTADADATLILTINGVDSAPFTPESDGTWQFLFTPALTTAGTYNITVRATDGTGNAFTSPVRTLTIPAPTPAVVETPGEPTGNEEGDDAATNQFPSPAGNIAAILGTDTNIPDSTGDSAQNNGAEVEGAASENKAAQAVSADANKGIVMGLAWYWWLLILAGIALLLWWIIAAIRRRSEENA